MNTQLYSAASGLSLESRRLDLIANNLANVSTSGYRAQRAFSVAYDGALDARGSRGPNLVALGGTYEVPHSGPLRHTGGPLDVALPDGSFLAVETPQGTRYMRAGSLMASPDGGLADASGRPVLGGGGRPITGLSSDASISEDGRVLTRGAEVGRLHLVRDPEGVLSAIGGNLLDAGKRADQLEVVADPRVFSGWIEESSADPVGELIRLIETQRSFERYQKLISITSNEVDRRAANDIAGS